EAASRSEAGEDASRPEAASRSEAGADEFSRRASGALTQPPKNAKPLAEPTPTAAEQRRTLGAGLRSARLPNVRQGLWREECPFKSRWFEQPGGRLTHYFDEGHGPPVVMVHGNPSWSFMWRRLIGGLHGFRRLAPDHLGLGLSSRPGPGYGFRLTDRLADFSAWLESLRLEEPVHLVVHDWGGPIGLSWAGLHPELTASLTIMNTGLRAPADYRPPARLRLFAGPSPLRRLLAVKLGLFHRGLLRCGSVRPLSPAAADGFAAPCRLAAWREAIGRFVGDIPLRPDHPSRPALEAADRNFDRLADKPVLLAWGLRDFVFSLAFLDDFRRRRPAARTLALPRAGHWLLEDEPARVLAAVSEFLASPDRP
ncbi:MAG: alpha/beta fold hydrolase, partial [Deltaproteobacteria bacterium]|nr:alpha/beta fold hydrolase [Deltaproteobacteria bacterium]